jgi:hypothetical protein
MTSIKGSKSPIINEFLFKLSINSKFLKKYGKLPDINEIGTKIEEKELKQIEKSAASKASNYMSSIQIDTQKNDDQILSNYNKKDLIRIPASSNNQREKNFIIQSDNESASGSSSQASSSDTDT